MSSSNATPDASDTSSIKDASTPASSRRQAWLDNYTRRISPLLSTLALVYLATFSIQAIWYDPQAQWFTWMNTFGLVLWALFVIDLLFRFFMAPIKKRFFQRNWLDTVTVVLPQFRALRALRAFTSGGVISKKSGLISSGGLTSAALAAAIVIWVGSVMVLNAERGAPNAEIVNIGDAVWWAFETVTTVGYGDFVPVTWYGRALAVLVMLVGISVLGIVTASLSAALVKRSHQGPDRVDEVLAELAHLKEMVARLEAKHQGSGT
jgi:voltage-gated potassium channel